MKTTVKSFFLLMFASATLASCENCGEISITEPTAEDSQWLVYGTGDTALFRNEEGDTLTYLRTGIYAQNVPGDGFSVTDDCIDQRNTQVTNIIEDKERKQPYLGTYILKKPDSLIVKIGVGSKSAWEIKSSDVTQEVTVGETVYPEAYVFAGTTTTADEPRTVYFTKDEGFVYVEMNNGKKLELIGVFNRAK
ncbi:hypothetical protein [Pontibacter flavimaris]|uniref:Uncharacterized protein n=1 Tax=Pontibacter flavimaris TaxID=1797110 RepID=A0A1Q5P8D4_9BACT|nr:hypothetical protein [Pontibacter flavimaris]OKL38443.1 hypothetical protein A3841_06925 [Pontibacter flavimaris]